VAIYLGTTGVRMNSADALFTGLATHLIDDDERNAFVDAVAAIGLADALKRFGLERAEAGESAVEARIERIEDVFSRDTAQEMIAALESGEQDEWATSTLEMLRSHCPTSIVATIELLRAGAKAEGLRECLDNELALGAWITARPDFVEGVRAVVIDKDRNPTWDPAALDSVDVDAIRSALAGSCSGTYAAGRRACPSAGSPVGGARASGRVWSWAGRPAGTLFTLPVQGHL